MIDVRLPDGQVINALTYTVKNPKSGLKTNKEYVGHIVAGLREHNVSEDYIARVSDLTDPVLPAHCGESLGDRFVERLGGHVERMRGIAQIVDNNGAGSKGHDGNLSYSLFVRLCPA
jgi:hypothetical protein